MLYDVKLLFLFAKIFGGTPFKITDNTLVITKKAIFYSIFFNITSLLIIGRSLYSTYFDQTDFKSRFLAITRTFLGYVCLSTDIIITTFFNDRISSALNHLHTYDVSAKYQANIHQRTLFFSQFIVIIVFTCWCLVGYLTFKTTINSPFFNSCGYCLFYIGNSMQVLKFCGFILLVFRRFDNLSQLVQPTEIEYSDIKIINKTWQSVKLQDVWWMHCNLSTAAEKINSVYSVQLLLWIFTYSFNSLSRIYTIINNEQVYNDDLVKLRDAMCVFGFFINLLIIIIPCHLTSRRANQVSEKVFSPASLIQRRPNIVKDNNVAVAYFCARKVQFTAASGFLNVNLPLLISIIAALTTYLVILHK